ncbi:phosphonate C-P lyase system protein PhnG [Rhizobium miluonense]|uniref:Alpha-D-ribose 1-methylphosphonate 5-triphosphate synthase subunit PhnG n=1 Tax=Rhizobium miluonense TaxID=411945 RepID=A0A1C3WCV1_9HYPH|nr:phosphonate C-P lyase system protein PhnG [Rhizobium miluonense]SCB37977.1 alpha-D-ribose 1-methylphosphonate 5-triphosphate synthase subunit PhnG [Rhizobium miluonense]
MKRAQRISTLALASPNELDDVWKMVESEPRFQWITTPEFASTMVQGRVTADGQPFNLGEVGITRCVLQIADTEVVGAGYVIGRARRRATLVALIDAMTQIDSEISKSLLQAISKLPEKREARRRTKEQDVAESKVSFSITSAGIKA